MSSISDLAVYKHLYQTGNRYIKSDPRLVTDPITHERTFEQFRITLASRIQEQAIRDNIPIANTNKTDTELTMFPAAWSWLDVTRGWDIQDQKGTMSCVGFTIADGLFNFYGNKKASHEALTAYNHIDEVIDINHRYSPRYTWMLGKQSQKSVDTPGAVLDDGMSASLYSTLKESFRSGMALEEENMPLHLNSPSLYFGNTENIYSTSLRAFFDLNIRDFYSVYWPSQSDAPTFEEALPLIKQWLCMFGPLAVEMRLDTSWLDADSHLDVLTDYEELGGLHAATIVGFENDFLQIKNSWGTQWGDNGTILVSPQYARRAFTQILTVY